MTVLQALVMAGGRGSRMARTHATPKPLVKIGGRTLLEIQIRRMLACVDRVWIAVGYRAQDIERSVREVDELCQARIEFLVEDEPLGTIGALAKLPDRGRTLVTNGDLLSAIPYDALIDAHRRHGAALTIATHAQRHRLTLGEVITDATDRVTDYLEKPVKEFRISSGTYVFEPEAIALLDEPAPAPLPALVRLAVKRGLHVQAWSHDAPWIDVNDATDLRDAEELFAANRGAFAATSGRQS